MMLELSRLGSGPGRVLNGTTWQRCTAHFLRNVLSRLPRKAPGRSGGPRVCGDPQHLPAAHPQRREDRCGARHRVPRSQVA
ncbi:MAG: transposase [Alphaproteobacteria bacterium]|nr:transposase [Alphaproteobacteria bacterium]